MVRRGLVALMLVFGVACGACGANEPAEQSSPPAGADAGLTPSDAGSAGDASTGDAASDAGKTPPSPPSDGGPPPLPLGDGGLPPADPDAGPPPPAPCGPLYPATGVDLGADSVAGLKASTNQSASFNGSFGAPFQAIPVTPLSTVTGTLPAPVLHPIIPPALYAGRLASDNVLDVAADGDRIVAATDAGLGISNDGGQTWSVSNVENGLLDAKVYRVFVKGDTIIASTRSGVVESFDAGVSWQVVWTYVGERVLGELSDHYDVFDTVPFVRDTGTSLLLSTESAFLESTDGGKTWAGELVGVTANRLQAITEVDDYVVVNPDRVVIVQNFAVSILSDTTILKTFSSTDLGFIPVSLSGYGNAVVAAGSTASLSTDGGDTWNAIPALAGASNISAVLMTADTLYVALTQNNEQPRTVMTHDSGATWSSASDLGSLPVTRFIDGGTAVFATTSQGIFVTKDHGASWKRMTPRSALTGSYDVGDVRVGGGILYGITGAGLLRVPLATPTDAAIACISTSAGGPNVIPERVAIDPGGDVYVISTRDFFTRPFVLSSTNQGVAWNLLPGVNTAAAQSVDLLPTTFLEVSGATILAGGTEAIDDPGIVSTDTGATFDAVTSTGATCAAMKNKSFTATREAAHIAGSDVTVLFSGGVLRSTDGGATVTCELPGLAGLDPNDNSDSAVFIGDQAAYMASPGADQPVVARGAIDLTGWTLVGAPPRPLINDSALTYLGGDASGTNAAIASENHAYFSKDSGATWVSLGLSTGVATARTGGARFAGGNLYLSTESGIVSGAVSTLAGL